MALGRQNFGLNLSFGTLTRRIDCLRYSLLSFSVFSSILGIVVFALCIWLKSDPSFYRWVEDLQIFEFYIGIYIILFGSCIIILTSCLACLFIANENTKGMKMMVIIYMVKYVCGLIGAAILLNYSTNNSAIQPAIKQSMLRLISQSQNDSRAHTLRLIQESIGCCGADGANDYLESKKPLPSECRNSVTGHTYFHGCVDELTWFLEEKASWLCGVAMFLCFLDMLYLEFAGNSLKGTLLRIILGPDASAPTPPPGKKERIAEGLVPAPTPVSQGRSRSLTRVPLDAFYCGSEDTCSRSRSSSSLQATTSSANSWNAVHRLRSTTRDRTKLGRARSSPTMFCSVSRCGLHREHSDKVWSAVSETPSQNQQVLKAVFTLVLVKAVGEADKGSY